MQKTIRFKFMVGWTTLTLERPDSRPLEWRIHPCFGVKNPEVDIHWR